MQESNVINFEDFKLPKNPGKFLLLIVLGIIAVILLFSSWFTVKPEEAGIVLRFGKYVRKTNPGLHLKIPFGIEKVLKVPVERQMKQEFGFRTLKAGIRTRYSTKSYIHESLMLTGDLNAGDVEWIVQYRIKDPYKYLFRVRDTELTFRAMNEAVMRQIIGDRTINEVLTVGRQEISDTATVELQKLCNQYETGIKVDQVVLQDVNPPEQVKQSFNEVNEAQQERESLINRARSEYNKVIPKAKGEAAKVIEESKGYALERVNMAKGDAARFNAMFFQYTNAQEVTRQRIYLETMNKILSNVGRKVISDEEVMGVLPLLNINTKEEN